MRWFLVAFLASGEALDASSSRFPPLFGVVSACFLVARQVLGPKFRFLALVFRCFLCFRNVLDGGSARFDRNPCGFWVYLLLLHVRLRGFDRRFPPGSPRFPRNPEGFWVGSWLLSLPLVRLWTPVPSGSHRFLGWLRLLARASALQFCIQHFSTCFLAGSLESLRL